MIVFVETNFVLELVLAQEQCSQCEELVEMAESGSIRLALPAYSMVEPYETLRRRHSERVEIARTTMEHLKLLKRSDHFKEAVAKAADVESLLIESTSAEEASLDAVRARLLNSAELIDLTPKVLTAAAKARNELDFDGQDSVVYASVVEHLKKSAPSQACFLNRNSKDFANPDVVQALDDLNCKLLPKFTTGLSYVRSQLA